MVLAMNRCLSNYTFSNTQDDKVGAMVQMYREVQLLCSTYNDIHKAQTIPAQITLTTVSVVVAVYVLFAESLSHDRLTDVFFGCVLLCSIKTVVVGFHVAFKLYIESSDFLTSWSYKECAEITSDHSLLVKSRIRNLMRKHWK